MRDTCRPRKNEAMMGMMTHTQPDEAVSIWEHRTIKWESTTARTISLMI